jgi:ornithine--oxo-acid transaminase
MNPALELELQFGAQNYAPLPVVLNRGVGVYVWDTDGKRYLDMMSAYSVVSHGHCHPKIVSALIEQSQRLAIVSRAFYTDQLGPWCEKLCRMTNMAKVLPMNTGAEAVETAIKAARKWAYSKKKVPADQAEIIVCKGNFHGRTTTIVGMSSETKYRDGFGPFSPGFRIIPYGDALALRAAITPNTAAFLVEPIQGEAGIVMPPAGYLRQCRDICREQNVLFMVDEVQTGLGRTGALLACEHEGVQPDGLTLGKALGGGLLPISAFLARDDVMDVFHPGEHGSTFGGNPLSVAVSLTALSVLEEENLIENSKVMGEYFLSQLQAIRCPWIQQVRGKGLFIGIEVDGQKKAARDVCLALLERGILSKDTHQTVLRLAPPLIISKEQLDDALTIIKEVFV